MKKLYFLSFLSVMMVLVFSCKDEDLAPIITFDSAGKGAYPRLVTESDRMVNLNDFENADYVYSIEFVDVEQGKRVAQYRLDVALSDNSPDNGDQSRGPMPLRSFESSEFQTSVEGFVGLSEIRLTVLEIANALGLTKEDVSADDVFKITGTLVTDRGSLHTAANSSAAVNGPAFRGHFDFSLELFCPTDLAGTYAFRGSEYWCGGTAASGEIEIEAVSDGEYRISDWSFGGYSACYEVGSKADSDGLKFREVCSVVSFTGRQDDFGETWTFTSDIAGGEWTIQWSNTFGESGTGVLVHPEGRWPFTLK